LGQKAASCQKTSGSQGLPKSANCVLVLESIPAIYAGFDSFLNKIIEDLALTPYFHDSLDLVLRIVVSSFVGLEGSLWHDLTGP